MKTSTVLQNIFSLQQLTVSPTFFGLISNISDVVLEADVSPQGCLEAENFDSAASCQLPRYFIGLPRLAFLSASPRRRKNCLGYMSMVLQLLLMLPVGSCSC